MKNNKKVILSIIILGLLGVVLIFAGSSGSKDEPGPNYQEYANEIEAKLEDFLLKVDGISKANVIVTLELPRTTEDNFSLSASENEETEPLPTVRGVAIACTNGNSDKMRMKIITLVSAYLGISSNRIEVIEIK